MTPAWTPDIVTTDLSRAVHYTLLWGLEGVALRTVGGAGDRVPFVNEAAVRRRLEEAELAVVAVDPGLFEGSAASRAGWLNDVDALADTVGFCQRLECGVIRVGALAADDGGGEAAAEALRRAADVAGRAGLRLAVRNDADTAVATGAALADLLARADHPALGADWRPADAFASGEDPAEGLGALRQSGAAVVCVGARDGLVEGGAWVDRPLGEGDVGWDDHADALAAAAVDGPLLLDALPGPVGSSGLRDGSTVVRLARRIGRR